jgi:hypothetical protein
LNADLDKIAEDCDKMIFKVLDCKARAAFILPIYIYQFIVDAKPTPKFVSITSAIEMKSWRLIYLDGYLNKLAEMNDPEATAEEMRYPDRTFHFGFQGNRKNRRNFVKNIMFRWNNMKYLPRLSFDRKRGEK